MQKLNNYFLEALKASLSAETVNWKASDLSVEEIMQIFRMASVHNVLPMIFEATFNCEVANCLPAQYTLMYRRDAIQTIAMQTMSTNEFQLLYDHLRKNGIQPCVVKGMISGYHLWVLFCSVC